MAYRLYSCGVVVDILLVLLMLIFAVNGYRQGFVVGALSLIGFIIGAIIGLQIGPLLARQFDNPQMRVLVSLITIFGLAIFGQALAGWLGSALRGAITSETGRKFDDAGGAVVSLIAVMLVAWLVAAPLADASVPSLARSIRESALLRVVDRSMPDQARIFSNALHETVDTRGFPDVFGGLTPTKAREVPAPDPRLAGSPVVNKARQSVVKVIGNAPTCKRKIEGSGFVYSNEHVMTNAHVVAGTKTITVEVNEVEARGNVVWYDPHRDLAVIHVPGLTAPAMPFAPENVEPNSDAIVIGFPLNGPFNAQSARIREVNEIRGPDIYGSTVRREAYTIRALVRSGNSGGPLIDARGAVLGIIFAAEADDEHTGFAITSEEASPVAVAARTKTDEVSTGSCT